MMKKLWMDDAGAVLATEVILVITVLFCGLVVGLTALRDAVVTELADVGGAIAALNQSYSFSGVKGHHAECTGSYFADTLDTCDDTCSGPQGNSRCVAICSAPAAHEGGSTVIQ